MRLLSAWAGVSARLCSTAHPLPPPISASQKYLDRVKLLDYWKIHDAALINEFPRSRLMLMVDRRPLVANDRSHITLLDHGYHELKAKLAEYGLLVEMQNSCLLDAVDGPNGNDIALFGTTVKTAPLPDDSPIKIDDVMNGLAESLGGRFMDVRMAMLTMQEERQRNLLARMQSLSRWSRIYRRCPECAAALKMRQSKQGAECLQCARVYYPTLSPVAITLVRNAADSHCLLVRHRGSANGVWTAVAGFAQVGESLSETARREVAEETGVVCTEVRSLPMTQAWPMPDSSLMCAHLATADMGDKIDICLEELESARWFSRDAVREALENTDKDPFLRGVSRVKEERHDLRYIPPRGAIAHHIIRQWVEGEM